MKDKEELAPGIRIPSGTPSIFLAHGGADIISPPEHSVLMYLALKRAGVPAEMHIYVRGGHGSGIRDRKGAPMSTWHLRLQEWMADRGLLRK